MIVEPMLSMQRIPILIISRKGISHSETPMLLFISVDSTELERLVVMAACFAEKGPWLSGRVPALGAKRAHGQFLAISR